LSCRLMKVDSHCKDGPNGGCFDYRTECFLIINPILLLKTPGYQACFESIKSSISFLFHFKNPFISDDVFIRGPWAKSLGFIGLKGIKLFLHSLLPVRGFGCLRETSGSRRQVSQRSFGMKG
jgi:hypothetical protein